MSRIPCSVDRGLTMSLVCRGWRDMICRPPPPGLGYRLPKLPWLLLTAFPDGSTRVACVLGGCPRIHCYLTVAPPGARVFGSHDGGWLLLHYRDRTATASRAHNVFSGAAERLPAELLDRDGVRFPDMVVLAVALSSPPNDAGCVAAAFVVAPWPRPDPPSGAVPPVLLRLRCLAFWRKGWALAREHAPPQAIANYVALEVQHIVYHDGAFHMIIQEDHIRFCKPAIEPQDDDDGLSLSWTITSASALATSSCPAASCSWSSMCKVYRETMADAAAAAAAEYPVAEYPWAGRELETLDGRILLVGQGCTRSYEVDQYPGLINGGIYFLDVGRFYNEQVILGVGNLRRHPCTQRQRQVVT